MELNIKSIAGGIALFVLGGLSVYLITRSTEERIPAAEAHVQDETPVAPVASTPPSESADAIDTESFYEAAEARREQQLANKADADRIAKLKATKERSVECKFWKQQQKTSSAAAKIEEKIIQHCTLQTSSESTSSSEASSSSADEASI